MKRKRTRLFHTIVVVGSTLAVPALAVTATAAVAALVASCDNGGNSNADYGIIAPLDLAHKG
jgi:hypothetical protein